MKHHSALLVALSVCALLAPACGSDKPDTDDTNLQDASEPDNTTFDGFSRSDSSAETQDSVADTDTATPPEDNPYECEPGTVQACLTGCNSAGLQKCLKEWGPCIPPDEFCGNCTDDDCDGEANEGCPSEPDECEPVVTPPECPTAKISVAEGTSVDAGEVIHLSGTASAAAQGHTITKWQWSVQAPAGSTSTFIPSSSLSEVTFTLDVAGQYLFTLEVWDDANTKSCVPSQKAVNAKVFPPADPEVGCADGTREGFKEEETWPQIAACFGAWELPGVTPDTVVPTCNRKAGNSGEKKDGMGCSSADICAEGWHVCETWKEVAAKSTTGCAGSVPPDGKNKSFFFAIRQPSYMGSVCGEWGDGFNDVFGCGNLGAGLGADKNCGPLDRVIASTQPNVCGFNEAEPPLGPFECKGGPESHLNEGALVTKKACQNSSCSYDGYGVASWEKGGVLCCRG